MTTFPPLLSSKPFLQGIDYCEPKVERLRFWNSYFDVFIDCDSKRVCCRTCNCYSHKVSGYCVDTMALCFWKVMFNGTKSHCRTYPTFEDEDSNSKLNH